MNIIITLDYELFLNDYTGTVKNCLVKPMEEFCKICQKKGIHSTIFVDAAYIHVLQKYKSKYPKLEDDYNAVVANIRFLHSEGHDIQLHIHPQWYYSTFDGSTWQLDWEHYKLSDMPNDDAFKLFKESKALLDSIIGKNTVAFRAGGYSIQEFDYINCFKANDIIADSSVLIGSKVKHKTHSYNYSKAPIDAYHFSMDICTPDSNGFFYEFPIASGKRLFILDYLIQKRKALHNNSKNWGDGGNKPIKGINRFLQALRSFQLFKLPHATIDYQSYYHLDSIYNLCKKNNIMIVIGHPKNFSLTSLAYFENFVNRVHKEGVTFLTIDEIINKSKVYEKENSFC